MLDLHPSRRRALACLVALCALAPAAARAERVTDVRIGRHGEYTRVVIELDGMAGYRLERLETPGQPPEILVKLDAAATPKQLTSQSDVIQGVKLESRGDGAVARVALRTRNVRLAEMKLSGPARIVLDLRPATGTGGAIEEDVASRFTPPATAPKAVAEPKPAPPPPAPAPTAPVPATKPAPSHEGGPPPLPPRVEAELEAAARGEDVIHGTPSSVAKREAAPKLAQPETISPPDEQTGAAGEAAPGALGAPTHAPSPTPPGVAVAPKPTGPPVPTPPLPPVIQPSGPDPNLIVGGAALLLALLLVVRFVRARRRAREEALAGIPPDAFDDRAAAEADHAPASAAEEDDRTVGIAVPPLVAADSAAAREQSSLFDDDEDEAKPDAEAPTLARPVAITMDESPTIARGVAVDDDLPMVAGATTAASASSAASAPTIASARPVEPLAAPLATPGAPPASVRPADDELVRLVRDIERRIAQIEQRLAQTAEARERIERQIVAQTEELRVQRAAIARTQRVLRTLARPEDLATEPVPRGPSS